MSAFLPLTLALAVAFAGQHLLTPLGASRAFAQLPKAQAPLGFALLAVAGAIAAVVVWRERRDMADAAVERRRGPMLNQGLLNGAVALVALAVGAVLYDAASWWAIYPWAAGLLTMVGAAIAAPSGESSSPRLARIEWLGLTIVVAVAVAFRLPGLEQIPPQVHGDEAACGLEARRILNGEVPNLLGLGWYDIPNLSFAISALFMRIAGDDLFGLRISSALLGVVSTVLLYGIVRRLYAAPAAFLAAFLLAVSHWHVHFSRIGTDYMQASFATLLALHFLVRARQDGRGLDWVLAGMAIGLACSVYYAGRVIVPIVLVVLAHDWLRDRPRWQGRGATLMTLAAVLFVAPTIAAMAWSPSTLAGRSSGVFVLSPDNLRHSMESLETKSVGGVMAVQTVQSMTAFNWMGETSGQHAHPAPLLDFWSGAVFAVGLIAWSAVGLAPRYLLIASWFWINLVLGSLLTVDAMFSPRMVAAIPVVFVFAALLLDLYRELAERALGAAGRGLAVLSLGAFLCLAALANYRDYFELHVETLQPAGVATALSRFMEREGNAVRMYVYGTQSPRYDTPRFLVPDANAVDRGAGPPVLPELAVGEAAILIVDAAWDRAAMATAAIAARYPQARRSQLVLADGRTAFEVYRIGEEAK